MRQHLGLAKLCWGCCSPLSTGPSNISLGSYNLDLHGSPPLWHLLMGKMLLLPPSLFFCSLWVAEQDWLLLLVLQGVLGQRSPVGGCSDTGVQKGALLWVGVMLEQGG